MTGRPHGAPPVLMDDPYADDRTVTVLGRGTRRPAGVRVLFDVRHVPHATRRVLSRCRNQDVEWIELPGTGRVYTFTIIRHPLRPEFVDVVPFVVAVISLDGAGEARLISNVVECDPDTVVVGMPVRVVWDRMSDTFAFPRFAPV